MLYDPQEGVAEGAEPASDPLDEAPRRTLKGAKSSDAGVRSRDSLGAYLAAISRIRLLKREEEVDLAYRRHLARFTGTVRDLGRYLDQFTLKLNYTDWNHRELEGDAVGTEFFNKQFIYRGEFRQRRAGRTRTGSWAARSSTA